MKICPKCGGRTIYAHQLVRMDIVVDGDNDFEDEVPNGVYDAETPYGPYECVNCGYTLDDLSTLPVL